MNGDGRGRISVGLQSLDKQGLDGDGVLLTWVSGVVLVILLAVGFGSRRRALYSE
jgi:hypothetical protein